MFYFDWTYILVLIGLGLTLLAQAGVRSAFSKYSKVRSVTGLTGATAAQKVLAAFGIFVFWYKIKFRFWRKNIAALYKDRIFAKPLWCSYIICGIVTAGKSIVCNIV